MFWNKRKQKGAVDDVLLRTKGDRRMLPDVPDPSGMRKTTDRRGGTEPDTEGNFETSVKRRKAGIRYLSNYQVKVTAYTNQGKKRFTCRSKDISVTGILLSALSAEHVETLKNARRIRLKFRILPGSMPEGYEMRIKEDVKLVRTMEADDGFQCGFEFQTALSQYSSRKKDRYMLTAAAILLFFLSATVILMRAESVIYFKFNKWLYLYSIITAVFLLSRYLFGAFYRPVPVDPEFTPGVTIVIPCFNEEEWIQRTILSCMNQNYPVDKLEVIVVDDCSTDRSAQKIKEVIDRLYETESERFDTKNRISYYVQPQNAGKRDALVVGVEKAQHGLVVFVDSDSFLDTYAIRNLVQPFRDPKMGGVAGRTDVANTYTNGLTKMQSVRYYIAFRIMKAAEGLFDCVTCLSGPLSCYRKEIVLEYKDKWLNQTFLGQKATFGDDRAMTNFVLRHHRTTYQDTAVCSTIVPNQYSVFLKQQMRWKRSWLRESLTAATFMWRKEPFAAVSFYIGLVVPIFAPAVVIYNLIYVPLSQHIFPKTFLVGMLLMSLMMSGAQLLLRKSSTWIFGLIFCFYYEAVLLWQMPIAVVTFWKSTWGTRMTQNDVEAQKRKEMRGKKQKTGDEEERAMEKAKFKTGLLGYRKKNVDAYIAQLKKEWMQSEESLQARIMALTTERDALQKDHDPVTEVLLDARNHAGKLRKRAEEEAARMEMENRAAYESQQRKLQAYEAKVDELVGTIQQMLESSKEEFSAVSAKLKELENASI